MRTFPGQLRTAPGRFSGGGAGGGAGFRSSPPATSERDHRNPVNPRRVFLEPHQIRGAAHQRAAPFGRGAVRVQCSPFPAGFRHPRGFPAFSLGNRGTGPPDRKARRGRGGGGGGISPGTPAPAPFQPRHHGRTLRHPRGPVQSSARPAVRDAPGAHGPPVAAVARHPSAAVPGETVVAVCLTHGCHPPPAVRPRLNRGRRQLLCRLSRTIPRGLWPERRGRRAVRPPQARHGYASDSKPSAAALPAAAAGRKCQDGGQILARSRAGALRGSRLDHELQVGVQHLGHAHHRFQLDILDVTGEQSGNRRLGHAQLPRDG